MELTTAYLTFRKEKLEFESNVITLENNGNEMTIRYISMSLTSSGPPNIIPVGAYAMGTCTRVRSSIGESRELQFTVDPFTAEQLTATDMVRYGSLVTVVFQSRRFTGICLGIEYLPSAYEWSVKMLVESIS